MDGVFGNDVLPILPSGRNHDLISDKKKHTLQLKWQHL